MGFTTKKPGPGRLIVMSLMARSLRRPVIMASNPPASDLTDDRGVDRAGLRRTRVPREGAARWTAKATELM